MNRQASIKLIALAFIYLMHVGFFDALMANGICHAAAVTFAASSSTSNPQKNLPAESSYRMLTKHEKAGESKVSLPGFTSFVSSAFAVSLETQLRQPYFDASAHAGLIASGLYCLFRVFLI